MVRRRAPPLRRALPLLSLAAILGGACDSVIQVGGAAAPPAPEEEEEEVPAADPEAPCASLDRDACLRSVLCTLDAPAARSSRHYVCREARGNCEIGLRQIPADLDRCDDREGCAWRGAACYCACRGAGRTEVPDGPAAEPCDCDCAGGPPPGCAPR